MRAFVIAPLPRIFTLSFEEMKPAATSVSIVTSVRFFLAASSSSVGQIDEDEYFGRVLYDELVAILKNIKTEHRKDKTTSDGAMVDNLMKELEDAQKLEGSADEKKIRTALKAIGINYDKLTEDERKLIKKILYKTAMLKPGTLAGNRGKHRR